MASVVLSLLVFASGLTIGLLVWPALQKFRRKRSSQKIAGNILSLPSQPNVLLPSEPLLSPYHFHSFVTHSRRVREILKAAEILSVTSSTVLIEGESGTGKEIMARALHETGMRKNKPFVAVHAAAIPETLIESELFGHEKGAFTGALEQRKGRFESAHGGTVFLDEVGDLSPMVQVKLLRVIQERCFERLGGNQTVPVDVRIMAATNKDLGELVTLGKFREDLYYRLNVVSLRLLPLRERREDIPLLVSELIARHAERIGKKIAGYRDSFLAALNGHDFPGNIRELENLVERAIVFCNGPWLEASHVDFSYRSREPFKVRPDPFFKKIDYPKLIEAYTRARGNKTMAARLMEIPESTFRYHLKKALQTQEAAPL